MDYILKNLYKCTIYLILFFMMYTKNEQIHAGFNKIYI